MELVALTCPNCGATIAPPVGSEVVRCAYCGHVFEEVGDAPAANTKLVDRSAPSAAPAGTGGIVVRLSRGGRFLSQARLTAEIIKIGSAPSSMIRIDGDDDVSRMHAVIEVDDGVPTVIDLGSAGGTCVNGAKVDRAVLRPGDAITVGKTRIDVAFDRANDSDIPSAG